MYVYVDEEVSSRNVQQQDDLCAADELISRVRESNTFVCILAGSSHGTPIRVDGLHSRTSFFEIELYQAALRRKRMHVFVRDDFQPEPRLDALLTILKDAFPEWKQQKRLSDAEIISAMRRLVDDEVGSRPSGWPISRAPIRRLVQALYSARGRNRPNPSILFLHGDNDPNLGVPRVEIIQSLIRHTARQENEERKLARLWIGLRELMSVNYSSTRDHDLLGLLNVLLSEWAEAGAWYGLHADTPLGCLAALNTLAQVRNRMVDLAANGVKNENVTFPGGSLASAKYSIAKHLLVRQDRLARYHEALVDVGRSLDVELGDRSRLLGIRGSILRKLGRLSDCIDDYEEALTIRTEGKSPPNEVGEMKTELGFAYLRYYSPRKGLRLCEEGVEMMREGGRRGFLARGLRKLSIAYLVNGRLIKAHDMFQEARDVAVSSGSFDQL